MEKIIDLSDLLRHEIMDLYSAEEQIIEALPKMIEKANNPALKNALSNHLRVTEEQKNRLDHIQGIMKGNSNSASGEDGNGELKGERRTGFFSRLFGGDSDTGSGGEKCKGTEGLIKEGEKMMGEDMTPQAMDSAIIASAQRIEHYEISGYGTARAFARELNLAEVADLLTQTLNEEYEADDQLTQLAVGRVNVEAEKAVDGGKRSSGKKSKGSSKSSSKSSRGGSKSSSSKNSKSGSSKKSSKPIIIKQSRSIKASRPGAKSSSKNSSKSSSKASRGASKSASKSSKDRFFKK